MLDRNTATQRLHGARDAFWFSSGAYALLTVEPSRSQLATFEIKVSESGALSVTKGTEPSKRETGYLIGFNAGLDQASARQVVEHSFRQMVLQSFEPTKDYAASNGLSLVGEPWYEFARHYRNAVAHNGAWDIRSSRGLPLTWKNKTLVASMHGTPIDGYLNWYAGLQLCAQLINVVSSGIR